DHFRALDDAAACDFAVRIVLDREGDAFVFPAVEIGGRITAHADLGAVAAAAFRLVFAEPVVNAFVVEHAAAVGVDVDAIGVRPDFARLEAAGGRRAGEREREEGETEEKA